MKDNVGATPEKRPLTPFPCENHPPVVIPAKAGIQLVLATWTPAYAGVTA